MHDTARRATPTPGPAIVSDTANESLTESIVFRLPAHLLEKIDTKTAAMSAAMPGCGITRSDAIRALILKGLAAE